MAQQTADDRLIVALDLDDAASARTLTESLGDTVSFYKIGLGLLGGGLDLATDLKAQGKLVFLDLKLYDIHATVEKAVRGLARHGLDFLTVQGDPHVVRAAIAGRGDAPTKILAVTFLTSLDRTDLDEAMIEPGAIEELTLQRAVRAVAAGADGVIASPAETAALRALPEFQNRLIVTPGIRPAGSEPDDQKRIATPAEAITLGADHIVVGRPVWAMQSPREAARAILDSLPAR